MSKEAVEAASSPSHVVSEISGKSSLGGAATRLGLTAPLAIGTLQWGTTWVDDKIINRTGCIPEKECQAILDAVMKSGVTLIDTAEGYGGGTAEKRLGRLLGDKPTTTSSSGSKNEPGTEKKVVIMTKFIPVPWRAFHSDFVWAVRHSCERLKVDCIDVYLLHSPVHWRRIEYWVESAAIVKRKGLIQAMGLSNANADQVRRAVTAGRLHGVDIVCNQVHYSLLDYNSKALQEMEKACRELDVVIVGFSPIGQGLLTDNLTDEKWKKNKLTRILRLQRSDIEPLRNALQEISKAYNKTMAQVAMNWSIQHQVVPLVGCRSLVQATDSLGCLGWSLKPADVKRLDELALDRSALQSPPWRRALFVTLFGIVNLVCRTLDYFGQGNIHNKKDKKE
ncbi:hypothetical protein ACA910_013508 [Epithemia clementina (nom. ined.)]